MRLYLAGEMTNLPDWGWDEFRLDAERLRELGHEVVNPHSLHPEPPNWATTIRSGPEWLAQVRRYMKDDLPALLGCDGIACRPGWRRSRHAQLEVMVAATCGLRIFEFADGKLRQLPCDDTTLALAYRAVWGIFGVVGANSASHGGHVEWQSRTPQYHAHKVAGHAVTAAAQLAGELAPKPAGEGAREHLERCLVRSALALTRMEALS